MKKQLVNILLILFFIGLFIYLLFSNNGLIDFFKNPYKISAPWFLAAFACQILSLLIEAYLTHSFLKSIEPTIFAKDSFFCAFVGQFFSAITPSASGGQPVQIYVMAKKKISVGSTTAALVQKFLVYQISVVIYTLAATFFRLDYILHLSKFASYTLALGIFSQVLVAFGIIIVSVNQNFTQKIVTKSLEVLAKFKIVKNLDEKIDKVSKQLKVFHSSNKNLCKKRGLLVKTHLLTMAQLSAAFLVPYCIYRSFYFSGRPPLEMLTAQTFINAASSLVPIPGGSGAAEAASAIFLAPFFSKKYIKIAIAFVRLVNYYFVILATAPFAYAIKNLNKKQKPTARRS